MQSVDRKRDQPIGGRFWVEAMVGRSPTGMWYRVKRAEDGAILGLKASGGEDPQLLRRRRVVLEREFHVLALLDHPRVLTVHEFGSDELSPYYTAEWLDEGLPAGNLPWRDVCAIVADVGSSLAALHTRGLLHGGVARENLGRAADGRAKLRDFGTLCCSGTRPAVVGTPAFVAPEVLQLQALDARADLFSLGALAYTLLTGRDAYPARELEGLRDAWRSAVRGPSRFAPGLPAALDTLVLRLLSLDRGRRPSCVAEVVDELDALHGLEDYEPVESSRGRLVVPRLVGRGPLLTDIRRCVLSLLGGSGGTLAIEGPPGSGRSRALDACVLEGKLLGAMVVRADAHAGAHSDWAVARSMCMQLLPELATAFKGFPRHVLGRVIASVQAGDAGGDALATLDRDLVLRELRDFLLALTRGQRLVFAIDDVDRIDEPSAALIALLAQRADDHGMLLAVSAESRFGLGHAACPALRLLRSVAASVELTPLVEADTQALLRSMFGEVEQREQIAKRVQRTAKGNPGATLELLHVMVERAVVRFERGAWVMPREGSKAPERSINALRARLEQLSPDALELALGLCVAQGELIALWDYPLLTSHRDFGRTVRGLHELVARRIAVMEGEAYRLAHLGFAAALSEMLSPEAKRLAHSALAERLAAGGQDAWRCARHLLEAGREREALEQLVRAGPPPRRQPLPFLTRVLSISAEHSAPPRFVHMLRNVMLSSARAALDGECLRSVLPVLAADLERMSGARRYREASDLALEPRRAQARTSAQELYESVEESERMQSPPEALRAFALLYADSCTLATQLYDAQWLDLLPELESLGGFCPELDAVAELTAATREGLRGRVLHALAGYERALSKIEERHTSSAVEELRVMLRMSTRQQLGALQAGIGSREAEQHAQILESRREFRDAAYRIRARLFVSRGNIVEARKWQQRCALLELQRASESPDPAGDAGFELVACAFGGDLAGMERVLGVVAELAKAHAGWNSAWCLGQCHRLWLQGDLDGAVEVLAPALDASLAGRHPHWGHAVAVHVVLLCEQDRAQDGVTRGRSYERTAHKVQVGLADRWLRQGLAYALGRSGKHAAAIALIDPLIDQLEGLGIGGLPLGSAYEIRAKIALYASDRAAFDKAAQRCADAYFETGNPAMTGKVAQLAEEAAELESPALA